MPFSFASVTGAALPSVDAIRVYAATLSTYAGATLNLLQLGAAKSKSNGLSAMSRPVKAIPVLGVDSTAPETRWLGGGADATAEGCGVGMLMRTIRI